MPARNSFPCAESLLRLVQLPLCPLPSQAEPFRTVQAPAEQRLLHFWLRLPISRTRGHGSRISCVTPVGSQHEAVWEAFTSRSEPISIKIWTNKNTNLVDCARCCADPHLFASRAFLLGSGVGGTLICASALRHHMSQSRLSASRRYQILPPVPSFSVLEWAAHWYAPAP